MTSFGVLLQIAFRNLFASFLNIIVGFIILAGTFLVLVGGGLLDSVDKAMSRSITGSVAGHIQVYSDKSKDKLDLYTDFGGDPDITPIPDFSKLRDTIQSVDNVQTVIPMGIRGAMITSGNTIDITLERLRNSVRQKLEGGASAEQGDQIASQRDHVRQIVRVLQEDFINAQKVLAENAREPEAEKDLQRANSDEFWASFDSAPLDALEFLENRIAPLATDADLLYIRYIGTDLDKFAQSFDSMKIVDGTAVPKGHRGFLFGEFAYEELFKLKTARRLDKIQESLSKRGKTIASDPELARFVKMNQEQTREIVLQLDRLKTQTAVERLQKALGSQETKLTPLLVQLFKTDDSNFQRNHDIFYKEIAPLLELYRVRIGDMLPIKTFTRSGYMESVNVKVYGTFQFEGLEKSPLSGALNLMDLMTFRSLYGYMNPARLEELKALKAASGAREVGRENAEAELFGGGDSLVTESKATEIDESTQFSQDPGHRRAREAASQTFTQEELDKGVVLNAAVLLKDPTRMSKTMAAISKAGDDAKMDLRVVSWSEAAGLVGQMITVAKLVLYVAVGIIFIVALVIINNAMMMATLQRVKEIGTMRAVGAQRGFVLSMVLTETVVLGLTFGAVGGVLGAALMAFLNSKGIPAPSDELYLFFAGPRLHPSLTVGNFVAAFVIVLLVSAISTLYPAFIATRVSPLEAMQSDE